MMNKLGDQRRRDAIKALVNLAAVEGFVIVAVVVVYFYTNNMTHLVGGVVGAVVLFAPLYWRFFREHGAALSKRSDGAAR